jgi:hypothetical protein
MCIVGTPSAPKAQIVDPTDRTAAAAADALARRRGKAQGYSSSLLGGLNASDQPSLARQVLGLG